MSIEMLPFALAGFQLGALGLVAMLLNGRMAAIQADQREIRSDIKALAAQQRQDHQQLIEMQRQDHQQLVNLILQIRDRKGEPA